MRDYPIPTDALDDRLAVVGTAGAGKTYLTIGAYARLLKRGSRAIGVDALGVMWGLRLMPDGETPSPYNVVIFGGPHGDLPLTEHAGALVGETVATMRESCIIDLSQLGTKAAERRFMLAFLTALYRATNKEPVHLIIDEADMWAPQRLLDKDGEAAKLLGMMETVVRRGRVRGFIPWLITQRPAVLSKDVLSQADGLVALKLTSKQDRDAIGAWIEGQADREQGKAILAALPTKQRGEGVLWIPARAILRDVTFPENGTYDSSRTPKRGEKQRTAELKPLDLGALKGKLAVIEAEAKANDPTALRKKLVGMADPARIEAWFRDPNRKPANQAFTAGPERQIAYLLEQATSLSSPSNEVGKMNKGALAAQRASGREEGYLVGHYVGAGLYGVGLKYAADHIEGELKQLRAALLGGLGEAQGLCQAQDFTEEQAGFAAIGGEKILRKLRAQNRAPKPGCADPLPVDEAEIPNAPANVSGFQKSPSQLKQIPVSGGNYANSMQPPADGLSRPQQRILDALAWLESVGIYRADRPRAAMLADASHKSSGFEKNVSTLKTSGYISYPESGTLALTDEGRAIAHKPDGAPTTADLHAAIRAHVSGPQWAILDALCAAYPESVTREELGQRANASHLSSGFEKNVSTLRSFGFADYPEQGRVVATSIMFVEGR